MGRNLKSSRSSSCHSIRILAGAVLIYLLPAVVMGQDNLPVFTSPIDITGFQAQLHAIAPDRNTGQKIEVSLPPGIVGPKFGQFLAKPLSAQLDEYWAVTRDAKTGMTAKEQACNGKDGVASQIQSRLQGIGHGVSAYDVVCNFPSTGKLLLHQEGSTLFLGYLLTNSSINFNVSTPVTCHAGHGTPACPTDPHISVSFAMELTTDVHALGLCRLSADGGTIVTQSIKIDGNHNLAGALPTFFDDLFLNHKVGAIERAIEATETQRPLPIDGYFKELRDSDACTGKNVVLSKNVQAFNDFETTVERRAIVFRMTHPAIAIPTVDVANPSVPQPTFTRPMISTNRPLVQAGSPVSVSGRFFPGDSDPTQVPVGIRHDVSNPCFGGATDLQWGPISKPARIQRLPGTAQSPCASVFEAAGLTPVTGYQFSARDCDAITCSLFSKPVRITTAKMVPGARNVVLTLDGAITLGTPVVSNLGTFDMTVTIPASASVGSHKLRAASPVAAAEVALGVSGAVVGKASIMMVGILKGETGCPNHPINSTQTDANFLLFGSGFRGGPVSIHLDNAAGFTVGSAVAQADGSFCKTMVGVPTNLAGKHLLVAVQNGAVQAQAAETFVVVSILH